MGFAPHWSLEVLREVLARPRMCSHLALALPACPSRYAGYSSEYNNICILKLSYTSRSIDHGQRCHHLSNKLCKSRGGSCTCQPSMTISSMRLAHPILVHSQDKDRKIGPVLLILFPLTIFFFFGGHVLGLARGFRGGSFPPAAPVVRDGLSITERPRLSDRAVRTHSSPGGGSTGGPGRLSQAVFFLP